ncbi:DUF3368 domain-containing protein [Candidatus Pacearchaeota archaeon]|nr:DUF3368 domain-containing protein [Candidatus Pacearchaeota archaeon]
MEREAVTNSSCLIYLAKINRIDLLKNIFKIIFIPKQVTEEIFEKNNLENNIIKKELNNFIKEVQIKDLKTFPIDKGENSAISYCLEKNIKMFLSDDKKARNFAQTLGIEAMGTLGILLNNVRDKKLEKEECKILLKNLIERGLYISLEVYSEILKLIEDA